MGLLKTGVRKLFIFPIYLVALSSCAQENTQAPDPKAHRYFYQLGSKKIAIKKTMSGTANTLFFVQLHDDENTAEAATKTFLQQNGGTLLSIENKDKRYITFTANNQKKMFDPNRMFTATGVRQNLKLFGSYTAATAKEVKQFAAFFLNLVPDSAFVVAVHNNTNGNYSVHSYRTDKTLQKDAAAIYINPAQDRDDFFITTNKALYKKLEAAGYNCVLQNGKTANDDGSLGFYYGRRHRSYVNVEAQSGHLNEQLQMLEILKTALE